MSKKMFTVVVVISALSLTSGAQADENAGRVLWLKGAAERQTPDGAVHALQKGDTVAQGDVIRTGVGAHLQLVMQDFALLALRPETSLRITAYEYGGMPDGEGRGFLDLIKGGLRSITGAIGHRNKDNVKVRGEFVMIGVRGTDHETFVIPGAEGSVIYDRVTLGGTYMESDAGRVDLNPGETGFAKGSLTPSRIERTPEFMHLAALRSANTGPQLRDAAAGDAARLQKARGVPHNSGEIPGGRHILPEQATVPVLPAQALGDNSAQSGFGPGGRCGGPCAGGLGKGRGQGKGP